MEYMALMEFIKYGTPALLFALVVLNVYQSTVIKNLVVTVKEMNEKMVLKEYDISRHNEIDRRLINIENKVFTGA